MTSYYGFFRNVGDTCPMFHVSLLLLFWGQAMIAETPKSKWEKSCCLMKLSKAPPSFQKMLSLELKPVVGALQTRSPRKWKSRLLVTSTLTAAVWGGKWQPRDQCGNQPVQYTRRWLKVPTPWFLVSYGLYCFILYWSSAPTPSKRASLCVHIGVAFSLVMYFPCPVCPQPSLPPIFWSLSWCFFCFSSPSFPSSRRSLLLLQEAWERDKTAWQQCRKGHF